MNCPDCGQPLKRLRDRLYQCETTELYYVSLYGKLGSALTNPPPSFAKLEPTIEEEPKPKKGSLVPPNLKRELDDAIGEEQIPNFLRFIKEQLNMGPFEFMVQPKKLKQDVMTRAFPYWLKTKGLA